MDDFDLINFIAGIIPEPIKQIGKKLTEKPIKSIKFTNGSKLEYKDIGKGYGWYRDNKPVDENYKFYDPKVKRNRQPQYRFSEIEEEVPVTPIAMDNLDKLRKLRDERLASDKYNAIDYPSGDKRINLRTKGRMNLATIPINILDSIAINSGRTNTDIKTNLGLVGKESTFGGFAEYLGNKVKDIYFPYHLVNNHAFYTDPIVDYYNASNNKLYDDYKTIYDDDKRIAIEKDIEYQLSHGGPKATTKIYDKDNVLADAFLRYADKPHKYNPGQENYIQMVNDIANEVWSEPQIQKWWEEEGKKYYEKGKKERKTRKSLED